MEKEKLQKCYRNITEKVDLLHKADIIEYGNPKYFQGGESL